MIDWLETFDNSTASYDRAFAENVMDSLIFGYNDTEPDPQPINWYTLQCGPFPSHSFTSTGLMGLLILPRGGSKALVDALLANIKTQPETGKRVTALSIDLNIPRFRPQVAVTINNEQATVYDHVVSTLPFGSLRLVDTKGCRMPFELQQAIQSLQYGPSVKVAMRFSTRWWETLQNHKGGVSRTDRPTRIVVYPSYGINTDAATMIVSYTWTQDAQRNAAFVKGSVADNVLRDTILSDLADMHEVQYEWLVNQYQDHHAWSWDNSEFSVGAWMHMTQVRSRS